MPEFVRKFGGWIVAGLAVLYAAAIGSAHNPPTAPLYVPTPPPASSAPSQDQAANAAAIAEPAAAAASSAAADASAVAAEAASPVAKFVPTAMAAGPGWYDPRYVQCISGCDGFKAVFPQPVATSAPPQSYAAVTPRSVSYPEPTAQEAPVTDTRVANPAPLAATKPLAAAQVAVSTPAVTPPVVAPLPTAGPCAENGSCYGDISALTGRPKTVEVHGYFRRDGTYVRGHYRSH